VDDDPGMLEGLQRALCLYGYEPILFSSAEAFLNHTGLEEAVCVLLDINLGDASGIDLMRGLQAAGYSVPVVCMTGNLDPAIRNDAMGAGCSAFLLKPFSLQSLVELIKKASAGRS
jgi:FixJ family two-component response regulator